MLNRITPGRETPSAHLIYQGIEAVHSAKHFPYVIPREVAFSPFFPERNGSLSVDQVSLDESVNQMEYLRLYSPGRFSRHIGNTLSWEIVRETEKPHIPVEDETQESQKNGQCKLWIFGSDRILYPLYRKLFGQIR